MSLSVFSEKNIMPNEKTLTEVLADTQHYWTAIKNHVNSTCGNMSEQWKYYSKKAGWILVIKSSDRTILYLIPQNAYFKVNFVFGEKAVAATKNSDLSELIIALILEATQCIEGRSFMIDVKSETDTTTIKQLVNIKYSN
jgi:hypothetical protein